jgi:hypothetical protein
MSCSVVLYMAKDSSLYPPLIAMNTFLRHISFSSLGIKATLV